MIGVDGTKRLKVVLDQKEPFTRSFVRSFCRSFVRSFVRFRPSVRPSVRPSLVVVVVATRDHED